MKDELKRETIKDCTVWDINAKCVKKSPHMAEKIRRKARRKNKEKLKNLKISVDNLQD